VRAPQRLAGAAVVTRHVAHARQQRRQQRVGEPGPARDRDVGHPAGIDGQPAEVVVGKLVGPKRPLPQLHDGGAALVGGQVGQVPRRHTAARRIENKRKAGHDAVKSAMRSGHATNV
jgi:hypothetical protein